MTLASYPSQRAFFDANQARERSPEWDYGVHWHETSRPYPTHRLSWVLETGELYLFRFGREGAEGTVRVLARIPQVGEYQSGSGWMSFKDAQPVERVLDGWADQHGDLAWLYARLADYEHENEVAAA